jgi:diphthamide synthase (EF-2-diphthine--ammonia ligase)
MKEAIDGQSYTMQAAGCDTKEIKMSQIDLYLSVFYEVLKKINGSNVVLSGAVAIKMHGLYLSRHAADLDVSIYLPTDVQKMALELLSTLAVNGTEYCGTKRVYRFVKGDLCMDLLIESESVPGGLLEYNYKTEHFKVQSVENIIIAKRKYNREKDWRDFADLKNQNFNF